MTVAVLSLATGLIIGFIAQRSRFCFVGGLRDWLLFRQSDLLIGIVALFLTAWIGFPLAALAGGAVYRVPPAVGTAPLVLAGLATSGGLLLGLVSILSNGCPMRQHVMAAQGNGDSWAYLGGFIVGAVLYQVWFLPMLIGLIQ